MSHGKFRMLGTGVVAVSVLTVAVWAIQPPREKGPKSPAANQHYDEQIQDNAKRMLEEGSKHLKLRLSEKQKNDLIE
jgi:hypothetical protein